MWLESSTEDQARRFLQLCDDDSAQILLENRYFTRLWIVQEICLAKQVRIFCGGVWVPWTVIPSVVMKRNFSKSKEDIASTKWLFYKWGQGSHFTLQNAIARFANMECQEPKDTVYGLIGLVEEPSGFEVDYEKSLYEVYMDVVKAVSLPGKIGMGRVQDMCLARRLGFPQETLTSLGELYRCCITVTRLPWIVGF